MNACSYHPWRSFWRSTGAKLAAIRLALASSDQAQVLWYRMAFCGSCILPFLLAALAKTTTNTFLKFYYGRFAHLSSAV